MSNKNDSFKPDKKLWAELDRYLAEEKAGDEAADKEAMAMSEAEAKAHGDRYKAADGGGWGRNPYFD